jgi:DNA-directed RNA polymerase subunit M/transcription elongation factor TFIIS
MLKSNQGTVDLPSTPSGHNPINFALPTLARLPQVESLGSILRRITLGERGSLTVDQINMLESLKWNHGNKGRILTLENRPLVYEIVGMCSEGGVESTCQYIQAQVAKGETHWNQIIFGFKTFLVNQERHQADIIRTRDEIQLKEGILECPKCHSMKTSYTQKQDRSADEPMTVHAVCGACRHRWRQN